MKRIVLALVLVCLLCGSALAAGNVVTTISTNDVNKAAMAIKFTHGIMKNKGMKATLFFTVYGVQLVDKTKPSPLYPTGETVKEMIAAFIKDGGSVLACPMCMKHVGGMTSADLLPGVHAQKGAGLEAVTTPDTLNLFY